MSFIQRFEVAVTTIADGSATAYTPNFTGKLSQIRYVKTDYAAGVVESEATRIRRAASDASELPLAASISSTSAAPAWAMSWAMASLSDGLMVRTSEAISSRLRSRS